MIDWGQIIQTVLEAVLTIALPVVVGYAVTWLRTQRESLLARLDEKARFMVQDAVRIAVQAAEQSGLAKHIADKAEEKKRFALDFAEKYLAEWGLEMDLDVLADMIEAEVHRQFKDPQRVVAFR